ncbi:receptor-like protein 50 [Salvia hispanica]|uniref:receptor-like protein 50 n=1 Tax=Salvia hispanica TaxID=49212 RepID=UPI002009C330|nr:receptor-like protein 50 [Salvia hispanica]
MLFFICILTSSFIFTAHSYNNKCLRHQEILLLQLRDETIFNSSLSIKLVRWNESGECCKWPGVECNASGYVVSLQLDGEAISGGIGDSSSLFRFKYLQKLNLAYNHFNFDRIPKGIGNFTYLTQLNLSFADFGGHVPSEIWTLTRLASLDISNYFGEISLKHPNLEMLVQNLTELRELYLDGVYMTSLQEMKNWGHIISSHLPNLTSLSMVGCFLYAPSPKSFWQLHSLSILRLDNNDLSEAHFLLHCLLITKLIHVDLSENSLTDSLPSSFFEGVSNIVHLDLSENLFSGNISHSLYALPSFLKLDLSYNRFNGTIQLDNFQSLPNLTRLGLSGNSL